MLNKRVSVIIFCFLIGALVYSATPYASITYAEGNSFILMRNGKSSTISIASTDVFGMEVAPGDIIQTGPGTFLELLINPISASLQIAENTSFRCDADATGTKSTGELYYGRVRAKVAKLSGSSSYRISSPSLVAGVRGTDFGCDVIAKAGAPVLNRVFCFEGSVLVAEAAGATLNTVLIAKDEMVEKLVPINKGNEPVVEVPMEKKSLSTEVNSFWQARPFVELPPPAPVSRLVGNYIVTERVWPEGNTVKPNARNLRIPNGAMFALVGLGTLACIGAGAYSSQVDSTNGYLLPVTSGGLIMIGSGTVLALISLLSPQ